MKSIPNITYLLGAGASANALPVINELPARLNLLKTLLSERCDYEVQSYTNTKKFNNEIKNISITLIEEIKWVLEELKSHSTIDTLAKRFYLISSRHPDLIRLKKVLYIYFLFEQGYDDTDIRKEIRKEVPDKRYDSFIATYISPKIDKLEIPGNIKIVTWNYDFQFDLAFSKYLTDTSIDKVKEMIQVYPNLSGQYNTFDYSKFGIVHLNGIVNGVLDWEVTSDLRYDFDYIDDTKERFLNKLCASFHNLSKEELRYLTYSWEDPQEFSITIKDKNNLKQIANKIFSETDVLVIIGYSFSIFNRTIDNELMRSIKGDIRRIYIQDTKENVEDVKNIFIDSFSNAIGLFKGRLPNIVSTVNYTNQFYIPPEMNL